MLDLRIIDVFNTEPALRLSAIDEDELAALGVLLLSARDLERSLLCF